MALRIEEHGNTQKIFRDNTLEGAVIKHKDDQWEYIYYIHDSIWRNNKGIARTEWEAFMHLGFFKGKRPRLEATRAKK